MNLVELDRALKQLRLGGIAAVLESRLMQAQTEHMAPIDLICVLVSDELRRRSERLLERRTKRASFREADKSLDNFDFDFSKKMNRRIVYELAAGHFISKHEDALFLGPPGTGKSHLAQALGRCAIQQGHRVLCREAHVLIEEIADATIDGTTRKDLTRDLATVPLLIIDDLAMRKLPLTAAEDLPELVMRRHERASTLFTSNRPVEDWGKVLGDAAAVAAMLDRLLHHGNVLKCGPRSWRTKLGETLQQEEATEVDVTRPGALLAGFDLSTPGRIAGVHRGSRQRWIPWLQRFREHPGIQRSSERDLVMIRRHTSSVTPNMARLKRILTLLESNFRTGYLRSPLQGVETRGMVREEISTWVAGRTGSRRRTIPVLVVAGSASEDGGGYLIRLRDELEISQCIDPPSDRKWSIRQDHGSDAADRYATILRGPEGFDLVDHGRGTIVGNDFVLSRSVPLFEGTVIIAGSQAGMLWFLGEDDIANIEHELEVPFVFAPTLSPRMGRLTRVLRGFRPNDEVLFMGETGTGKEVYARALHDKSGRAGPFVALNCATFGRDLIESELFGFRRGAHSQATFDKPGLISLAEGGTAFLDEIGDMPPDLQAKLLRLIETREYFPIGSTRALRADVRIMAATSRDREFLRPDLLYRFGDPLTLPPLRKRKEDIPFLLRLFVRESRVLSLGTDTFRAFMRYDWPGNVRQLRKTVERAADAAFADGKQHVSLSHLPESFSRSAAMDASEKPASGLVQRPDAVDAQPAEVAGLRRRPRPARRVIEESLSRHRGNVSAVARELARDRPLVWRWLRELGIDPDRYR
jgi:transcriptional regulator with AAA-type ATPase domain